MGMDMRQQNALAGVGELGRQRQGVARALGAVDADDEGSGVGSHDGTHSSVHRPPGSMGSSVHPDATDTPHVATPTGTRCVCGPMARGSPHGEH